MQPEWVVIICAVVALTGLWFGFLLGRAHAAQRLHRAEGERAALAARVRDLEDQIGKGGHTHPAA